MPCLTYDGDFDRSRIVDQKESQIESLKAYVARLEAALCTAMTFIEKSGRIDNYIAATDWQEAGINPEQVQTWWGSHKEKDRKRRAAKKKKLKAEQEKIARIQEEVKMLQTKTWSELTKSDIEFLSKHTKK